MEPGLRRTHGWRSGGDTIVTPALGLAHASTRRQLGLPLDAARSWDITRAISPRAGVRTADVDAYGQALNSYSGRERRTTSPVPDRPWAMYLSDEHGQYRYLAFDLDAGKRGAAAAEADADTILGLLDAAGIRAVVCQSGPTFGRHVWIGFADAVDAGYVDQLAAVLPTLCPTLDLSPWNTTRGCVRPPGSPHRAGGASTVIRGTLDVLTHPSTSPDQFAALVDAAAAAAAVVRSAEPDNVTPIGGRTVAVDADGHRYLPGAHRDLPMRSRQALSADAAAGDASAVLWRILCGAARAHWHYADVAALIDHPGMEHVRTRASTGKRVPRPSSGPQSPAKVLAHHWDRAVRRMASVAATGGSDPTFPARADGIARLVEHQQTRATASPGRWGTGGGPSDRRVLDALHTLALQAVTPTVEADVRRVADLTGLGKTTVATALQRLAADRWIAPVQQHAGVHGTTWTIDPQVVLPSLMETSRTQAATRPAGAEAARRSTTLATITTRLRDQAHDLFTGRGALPLLAGNLYAHTSPNATDAATLATAAGTDAATATRLADRLVQLDVLVPSATGWRRPAVDRRDRAAKLLRVDGRLRARTNRHAADRQLWAWWQGELARMTGSSRFRTARKRVQQVTQLWRNPNEDYYPRHPRDVNGRADYAAARAHLVAGAIDTAEPLTIAA